MGRPSLAAERRAEILDAFEASILRHGLAGSSLDKIAAEAGMARNMIRHYLGNRADLVRALVERFLSTCLREANAALDHAARKDRAEALLDPLFGAGPDRHASHEVIFDELWSEAGRDPALRDLLRDFYRRLLARLGDEIAALHPETDVARCHDVAYAIFAISQTNGSLVWLGFDAAQHRGAREAAARLLAGLEGDAQ